MFNFSFFQCLVQFRSSVTKETNSYCYFFCCKSSESGTKSINLWWKHLKIALFLYLYNNFILKRKVSTDRKTWEVESGEWLIGISSKHFSLIAKNGCRVSCAVFSLNMVSRFQSWKFVACHGSPTTSSHCRVLFVAKQKMCHMPSDATIVSTIL